MTRAAATCLVLMAVPASADDAPATATAVPTPPASASPPSPALVKSFGIDAVLVLPLSDYADQADLGFGALGRIEIPRSAQLSITVRAGVLFHSSVDETLVLVPIYGGARFALGGPWSVTADGGLTYRYLGKSEAAIGLAFGVGYRKGALHLGGEILVPDLGLVDSSAGVMLTAGYVTP